MTTPAPQSKLPLLIAAMKAKPNMTQGQIAMAARLTGATVSRHVNALWLAGEIHISGWVRLKNDPSRKGIARYSYGPGKDVRSHVRPKSPQERTAAYRKRKLDSGEWEDMKKRQRDAFWLKKTPQRDPLTAALFGATP
jgi:hypothetical protein